VLQPNVALGMILIATSLLDDLCLYDGGIAALIETHGKIERRNGGRAADNEKFGERSAVDMVAGGAVIASTGRAQRV
jgi:hypothetical protein